MPSLRKRVTSYFRQLSFHNEPREKRTNLNENSFVTKYLQGHVALREGPPILYGKNPTDLPNYELGQYETGGDTIVGCYTGPCGGLTTVRRHEKHLSLLDADIDFIDTPQEEPVKTTPPKKPQQTKQGLTVDNTTMIIKVAGQEYCVTNRKKRNSKSLSLTSLTDIDKTKTDAEYSTNNNNSEDVKCKNTEKDNDERKLEERNGEAINDNVHVNKSNLQTKGSRRPKTNGVSFDSTADKAGYGLSKSRSEGNPFQHRKKGKIIRITHRPVATADDSPTAPPDASVPTPVNDKHLPKEWSRKSDYVFGLSDSLYDMNQVTKKKNGHPIADCFGIIARGDSAILAVADGVNWGEKACVAAKSAIHGCLHYLNKTVFSDTSPFDDLTIKSDSPTSPRSSKLPFGDNRIVNTREVFVCLLRAFNCAHDLILENDGMLTTLTVAVVLPLKPKHLKKTEAKENIEDEYMKYDRDRQFCHPEDDRLSDRSSRSGGSYKEEQARYVCCVCNVGDTLAYVYSQKFGVRELTKGSHDINCNRDMRDALGALGPVDGIKPELSNLTLSITTLQKGDIVMVASDGLTDNFDPNVCRFTVNCTLPEPANKTKQQPPRERQENLNRDEAKRKSHRSASQGRAPSTKKHEEPHHHPPKTTAPVKPPRKSKTADSESRSSTERSLRSVSIESASISDVNGEKPKPAEPSEEEKPVERVDKNTDTALDYENPLVAQFMRENSLEDTKTDQPKKETSQRPSHTSTAKAAPRPVPPIEERGYKFLRSRTALDFRSASTKQILRNAEGIPFVTPLQRYELTLLLMEDVLKRGISGRENSCATAKKLCENLVRFTFSITAAKRRTLEDLDLYFDNRNGVLVEVSVQEKKARRKRGLQKVQNLPGKMDHVTVVAWNVGNCVV